MRKVVHTTVFEKDLKRMKQRGHNEDALLKVVKLLQKGKTLPRKYDDHPLISKYKGRRDCHIEEDWVLIYKNEKTALILERTGTHTDLFQK